MDLTGEFGEAVIARHKAKAQEAVDADKKVMVWRTSDRELRRNPYALVGELLKRRAAETSFRADDLMGELHRVRYVFPLRAPEKISAPSAELAVSGGLTIAENRLVGAATLSLIVSSRLGVSPIDIGQVYEPGVRDDVRPDGLHPFRNIGEREISDESGVETMRTALFEAGELAGILVTHPPTKMIIPGAATVSSGRV
jgi:hypothetical protein